MNIKLLIKSIDNYFGKFFNLEIEDYIQLSAFHLKKRKKNLNLNNVEWHNYFNEDMELSNFKNWHKKLANEEARKFFMFYEIDSFIKNQYSNILEIGSGLGYIGYFLSLKGHQVNFSDVLKLKLPFQDKKIRNKIINFSKIKPEDIKGHDLILATHVDYIFTSRQIINFLRKCSSQNVDVIFCNTSLIGPLRFLKNKFQENKLKKNIRKNGYKRSALSYFRIGRFLNYQVSIKNFENKILKLQNWKMIYFTK